MNMHDFASLAVAWLVVSCAAALLVGHLIKRGRGSQVDAGEDAADDPHGVGPPR